MTTKEILVAAKALIEKPEAWTRGVLARDAAGFEADVRSPAATCFCASGAIMRTTYDDMERRGAWDAFHAAIGEDSPLLTTWNDNHGHAEVLAMFDKAIAAAEPPL